MSRLTGFPHRMVLLLFAVLALSTPVLAQSGAVTVSAPTLFDIGGTAVSIATGDLDGDGALDIAAADPDGQAITVLSGNGNGGLQNLVSHPLAAKPSAVALADVDGDGALDIVVAFSETGGVAVLRNAGSGSFAAPAIVNVGGSPSALATGDFNADGSADVAALDRSGARIAVLLGDGTGSLGAPAFVPVTADTVAIAAGDVDGDGGLDLITADGAANTISILRADGTGGFSNASVIAASHPRAIAATDLNGDGRIDLVLASETGTAISALLGDGGGGFASPAGIEIGARTIAVAAGDLNGDGAADLAAALVDGGLAIVLNLTPQASSNTEEGDDSTTSAAAAPEIGLAAVECHYTFIHSSAGTRNWNDPTNWSPLGPPGPADTACIPSPEDGTTVPVFVTVPVTVGTIVLKPNVVINIEKSLSITDGADLSGDISICGDPFGDAELAIASSAVVHLNGIRIDTGNDPPSCAATSRVTVAAGATVRNESGNSFLVGRIDFAGRAEAASGRLTFRSHRDFGITSRWGAAVLAADDGATIELAGVQNLGAGSRKIGAGLLDITGEQIGHLMIDGPSRLAPSPSPGTQGGSLGSTAIFGTTVVSNVGSIDIVGVNVISRHTLVVNGTATLQLQNGGLCLSDATIEIAGTLEIRVPEGAIGTCGMGGSAFLRVQPGGTFRKHADSTGRVQLFSGIVLANNGSVNIDGGHLWIEGSGGGDGGVYRLAAGTMMERLGGTWSLNGSVQGEGLARLSGGTLSGSGGANVENLHLAVGGVATARITGTMTWDGGTVSGSLQIDPGATLTVPANPRPKQMTGALIVLGTVVIDHEFCFPGSTFVHGGGLLHFRQAVLGRCGGTGQITINPNGTLQSDQTSDPLRQILFYPTRVFGKVAVTSGTLRIWETNQWEGQSQLEISGGAIASFEMFDKVQNFAVNSRVIGGGTLEVNGIITGRPAFFATVNVRNSAVFDGASQADASGPFHIFGGRLQNGYVLRVLGDGNLHSTSFSPCGGEVRVQFGKLSLRVPGTVMQCFGQGALVVEQFGTLAGAVNPGQQIDLSVPLTNQGTVVTESGNLRFFGSNLTNDDGGTITGGTWIARTNTVLGPFGSVSTNAANVALDGPGATFAFSNSGLALNKAAGRLTVHNGATLNIGGFNNFTNDGTVEIAEGTFNANTFLQRNGVTRLVHAGAVLTTRFGVPSVEGGVLEGIGTARPGLRNAGGIVDPGIGNTIGVLHVDGDYVETPEGTLKMFLRSATEYSALHVAGAATFAGTLRMDPWTEFDAFGDPTQLYVPMEGDTYDLVTYGAHVDTHALFENGGFTVANTFFKRRYDADKLNVTVSPRTIFDEVVISPAEGPAQTIVLASFADVEFGGTDPAEYFTFVQWSDMPDAAEATLRYDETLNRFVLETTRGFVENGPVDLFFQAVNGDGAGVGNFLTVDVRNLPASVTPAANRSIAPGTELTFDVASFADPGVLDTHAAMINWGDGTLTPGVVTEANGSGTVAGTHTYQASGKYMVIVTLTDDDGAQASASFEVTVEDATAPTCTASASRDTLWPPNNTFVPVTLQVSGAAGYQLVSVTTNQGDASSETRGFTLGTADTEGELRAARFGGGSGRVYTLTYRVTDAAGNSGTCSATVTVPHDQGKKK